MKTKRSTLSLQDIERKVNSHRRRLRELGVRRLGLFGSYARKTPKAKSDLDFLVEFNKPSFDNFMDLVALLENAFRRRVDLITDGNLSPYLLPLVEKDIRWYEV